MTVALAAAVVGLLIGSALVPGAPIFGLPIVAILVVVLGVSEVRRRQAEQKTLERHREQGESGNAIEFTERDRETLV